MEKTRNKSNKGWLFSFQSLFKLQKLILGLIFIFLWLNQVEATDYPSTCGLSVKANISGCFTKEGKSIQIIHLEVSWDTTKISSTTGSTDDLITLTIGEQTKTINPGKFNGGTIRPPYPIAFEVPADGETFDLSISGMNCSLVIEELETEDCGGGSSGGGESGGTLSCTQGQLGGVIFSDNNADGIRQNDENIGFPGVTIIAYGSDGEPIDTAISNPSGRYVLQNIQSQHYPVRIHFIDLPEGSVFPSLSDIRFVFNPSCNINFPVYNAAVAGGGGAIPFATTCFVEGDNLNSDTDPRDVIVVSTTAGTNFDKNKTNDEKSSIVLKDKVGSVWGLAFNENTQKLFSSAFLKRHNGLGPLGLGGIYFTDLSDPANPATDTLINLANYVDIGEISEFGLTGSRKFFDQIPNGIFDPSEPSWDQEAFGKVGKVGLGDIDFSSSKDTLFVVNLFSRKVLQIDLSGFNVDGTLPDGENIDSLPDYVAILGTIPSGTYRPFGLKMRKDTLYLGIVTDGFPAYTTVIAYDFSGDEMGWHVVLPWANISYDRPGQSPFPYAGNSIFRAWIDEMNPISYLSGGDLWVNNLYVVNQAILSDIEFDNDGNMILGFMDRLGHQLAADNYSTDTTSTIRYSAFTAGEILMAFKTSTGYVLESDASKNEYFKDNAYHPESSNGGLAYDPATNTVIVSAMDPVTFYSGGLIRFDVGTGKIPGGFLSGLTLYEGRSNNGFAGKGAGIGDVELLVAGGASEDTPGILQIGNFVWVDINRNGRQDPQEPPLGGLLVSLYKEIDGDFVFVAYTQTDATGSYAFTGYDTPGEFWVDSGAVLLPEMEYKIVFGYKGGVNDSTQLVDTNIIIGGIPHYFFDTVEEIESVINSDAMNMELPGGSILLYPSITLTTPSEGIDHSYDLGLVSDYYQGIGNLVWYDQNFNGEQDPGELGIAGVKVNLHECDDNDIPGVADPMFMKTTNEFGNYIISNVPEGNYALSFDYSMADTSLRFTLPNINLNTQDFTDSDVLIALDYYANPTLIAFTGCFKWEGGLTDYDPTFDAGLTDNPELIDPTGYVYCESNGEILKGGKLTVTGPGNVYMIHDASDGYYQYYVDAVGVYTMTLTNPPGYESSLNCLAFTDTLDAPVYVQIDNPYSIGSGDDNGDGFLDVYTCAQNELYHYMLLEPGDFIINNNFPMACSDWGDLPAPFPTLAFDAGPSHAILQNPLVLLGNKVDGENDGQPEAMAGMMGGGDGDDEDGLLSNSILLVGFQNEVVFQAVNKDTVPAKLTVFIDLNDDKDFNDAGEMQSAIIDPGFMGPVTFIFNLPLDSVGYTPPYGEKIAMRVRITTDLTIMSIYGNAKDGEVEDYMMLVSNYLPGSVFSCTKNSILPLHDECQSVVSSTMFTFPTMIGVLIYATMGEIPSSFAPGEISFFDTVYGEGEWKYGLYSPFVDEKGLHQLLCDGTFTTQDMIDPYFVAKNLDQYGTYKKVTYAQWSDALNEGTFNPHLWSCWQSTNHLGENFTWPNNSARTFDTLTFIANQTGVLTIIGSSILNTGTDAPEFDPVFALYSKGGFDKNNPCQNLIGFAESTFIPNPFAGQGYGNELTSSLINGTLQDQGDVFAPWLLHPHPMARLELKVEQGECYTLLVTHRAELTGSGAFDVYFMWNGYTAGIGIVSAPGLVVDSSYAYFDLLCADLNTVMINNKRILNQDNYTGGTLKNMSAYLDTEDVNSAWYALGHTLLGQRGRIDTSFVDLNQFNITGDLFDDLLYACGFMPMVIENCSDFEVCITDEYQAFGDCGYDAGTLNNGYNIAGVITRTFVVSDKGTNTDMDTAQLKLYFRNPNLYDVRLPHYTVNIECDEAGEGIPSPSVTGYPFVATLTGFVDLTPNNALCNLAAGYTDKALVEGCSKNYSFRREWTIYDFCRPGTTIIYHQLIQVGDYTAPELVMSSLTMSTSFSASECSGSVTISRGIATDECSNAFVVIKVYDANGQQIQYSEGTSALQMSGLAQGNYTVEWMAMDGCGNSTSKSAPFVITDNISPSCVIDDLRTITLTDFQVGGTTTNPGSRGEAYLTADRLDEGSWDNCYEVNVQVRRSTTTGFTSWNDFVGFTCEDEGKIVIVEMIVRAGNDSTVCSTQIRVEDRTIPECREIGTVTLLGTDMPSGDLSASSSVWDSYFADSLTVSKVSTKQLCNVSFDPNVSTEVNIGQCSYGWVNRYYRVYRTINGTEYADTCRMSVVFSEDHDYWVTFPADEANANCGSLKEEKVKFHEGACDLITISQQDQVFESTADECYKIFRTYRIINWCEYDGAEVAYQVARKDWNRDGMMGDATTINVKYQQGVQHEYWDYKNRFVTVVGATNSLNPTGATQSDADRRDTVYRVGAQTAEGQRVYWESAAPISNAAITSALINNATVQNIRNYVGIHPTPVTTTNPADYIPQGFFEYTQHLKVFDNAAPEIEVLTENLAFASYSNDKVNLCPGAVSISVKISDDCTTQTSDLDLRDVLLDQDNNGLGSITYVTKKYDASSYQGTTLYQTTFSNGLLTISSSGLPKGTHKFTVVVSDGCGNVNTEDIVFKVEDKKAPAPICLDGLAVELMPAGTNGAQRMAIVNAVDFVVNNPISDCSGDVGTFRISKTTSNLAAILASTDLGSTLNLTCTDKGQVKVAVVATDAAGNSDYCITTITVQDNVNPCSGSASVAGLITTEDNNLVSGVEVNLNAAGKMITAADGGYFFHGLSLGGDYTVAPKKDAGFLNGVSTYDLVLINRHILGLQLLDSPYKMIAADANNSGSITTLDLIQLRKLILNVDAQLPNTSSWRFIPSSFRFPNPSNPWATSFPEVLNINNITGSINGDFVAIKVGDVNNSAILDIQARSNAVFAVNIGDVTLTTGNTYTVEFLANSPDIEGFQMALSYQGLELVDVLEGLVKTENMGTKFISEGLLLTSWNGSPAQGKLFGLVFRATADGKLSDAIRISTKYMHAEAYNEAGEAMRIGLNFNHGLNAHAGFELHQNMPNPFKDQTSIGFNLPETGNVTLTINDVTGRVLKVVRGDFAKGSNQIIIQSKDLPASGIMYYTLTSGSYTATKKMILLD
jgi:hypothetical protein